MLTVLALSLLILLIATGCFAAFGNGHKFDLYFPPRPHPPGCAGMGTWLDKSEVEQEVDREKPTLTTDASTNPSRRSTGCD